MSVAKLFGGKIELPIELWKMILEFRKIFIIKDLMFKSYGKHLELAFKHYVIDP